MLPRYQLWPAPAVGGLAWLKDLYCLFSWFGLLVFICSSPLVAIKIWNSPTIFVLFQNLLDLNYAESTLLVWSSSLFFSRRDTYWSRSFAGYLPHTTLSLHFALCSHRLEYIVQLFLNYTVAFSTNHLPPWSGIWPWFVEVPHLGSGRRGFAVSSAE